MPRILAAALALVDARGVSGLTMRALAARLGVDPMAVYYHLPGRDAVLRGVVAQVFAELEVAGRPDAPWRDQVRAFAAAYRALARAHPHLVLHLVTDLSTGGEAVLQATELLYAALDSARLPPRHIAVANDLIIDYLHGVALGEADFPGKADKSRQPLFDLLRGHGGADAADRYPTLTRVSDALPGPAADWDADAGLELVLAGIATLIPDPV